MCAASRRVRSLSQRERVREENPWVNDLPGSESQRGQQPVGEAERPRSRVWSGSARLVCSGESLGACTPVSRDATGHPSITTADATPSGEGRPIDAAQSLPPDGRRAMSPLKETNGAPTAHADVARIGMRDCLPAARSTAAASPESSANGRAVHLAQGDRSLDFPTGRDASCRVPQRS
jgi:hypothetical protein